MPRMGRLSHAEKEGEMVKSALILRLVVAFAAAFCLGLSMVGFAGAVCAGTTELVSVSTLGQQSDQPSYAPSISADGRFVGFYSHGLDPADPSTNGYFVRDRLTGSTRRVPRTGYSIDASLSADGRFVVFASDVLDPGADGYYSYSYNIFVADRVTGTVEPVPATVYSGALTDCYSPLISADGRYVVFGAEYYWEEMSFEISHWDYLILIRDRVAGQTWWLVEAGWRAPPSISPDARFVAYGSPSLELYDRISGTTEVIAEWGWGPSVSADGTLVAFASYASDLVPGDLNGYADVFVHDRLTGATERVSVSSSGEEANGRLTGWPSNPAISADGRYVAFESEASNLVPGDLNGYADVFVHDRLTGVTERVSVSTSGEEANGYLAGWPSNLAISADGRYVAFASQASNLVPVDTNGQADVFVHDRVVDSSPPDTRIVSGPCGQTACAADATICWTGSDDTTPAGDLTYLWRVDGGEWQGPAPDRCVTLAGIADGWHAFEVKARDAAGNEDPTPAQCSFILDVVGPSVSISSPANGATVRGVVNISAIASSASGIQRVEFYARGQRLCSDSTAPYSCNWDTTPLAVEDGAAEICARALNWCGRSSQQCVNVTVDNTVFDDVAKTDPIWPYVAALVDRGITAGCSTSPPRYCPYARVTRAQMAKFVCVAAGKTWLERETPTFADVPKGHPLYGWIERLTDAASWGGTPPAAGCEFVPTRKFCPGGAVTREYLAMVLCLATGKPQMAFYSGVFPDVPRTNPFARFIERLAHADSWPGDAAVTSGCATNPPRYCPKSAVTRGQMAVFLVRAFGFHT